MTKDDFIRMNRGINNDGDLPAAYLSELYDDIHGREIKMTEDISEVRKPRNKTRRRGHARPQRCACKQLQQRVARKRRLGPARRTSTAEGPCGRCRGAKAPRQTRNRAGTTS